MTLSQKIALVTGANRGIGFEVCRQLSDAGLHVILASRDPVKGRHAAGRLRAEDREVSVQPLDVTDPKSVAGLLRAVRRQFGRLDVLINNAGVYLDEGVSVFDVGTAVMRATLEVNFFGPLSLCRAFVPLMQAHGYGRVVNVSSRAGQLTGMRGRTAAYKVSKAALNALTLIVADEVRPAIKVNAMYPGWVRTDMGGPHAPRSPEEAADTVVWLATLPASGPTGGFFRDRKRIAW
ncbi:MAG TPA: SDR family oxidoreductase [bacterium]|nr:SDR family oxidoreductase [bacterium]